MPDSPEKARFLTEEERAVAKARSIRQAGSDGQSRVGNPSWADVGATLLDIKVSIAPATSNLGADCGESHG